MPSATAVRSEWQRAAAGRNAAWTPHLNRPHRAGDVDGAYWLVEPYSVALHGTDATLVAIETPIDSGKAHVAHGLDPNNSFAPGP